MGAPVVVVIESPSPRLLDRVSGIQRAVGDTLRGIPSSRAEVRNPRDGVPYRSRRSNAYRVKGTVKEYTGAAGKSDSAALVSSALAVGMA